MLSAQNNPIANYVRTSYQELSKVAWPTRQHAIRQTMIVIVACAVVAAAFGALDFGFNLGLEFLVDRF